MKRHGKQRRQPNLGKGKGAMPPQAKETAAGSATSPTVDDAYQRALSIADQIRSAVQDAATEQDVRLQIIDRVLIEILGWTHNQISTEVNNNRGYADYALRNFQDRYVCVRGKKAWPIAA